MIPSKLGEVLFRVGLWCDGEVHSLMGRLLMVIVIGTSMFQSCSQESKSENLRHDNNLYFKKHELFADSRSDSLLNLVASDFLQDVNQPLLYDSNAVDVEYVRLTVIRALQNPYCVAIYNKDAIQLDVGAFYSIPEFRTSSFDLRSVNVSVFLGVTLLCRTLIP